MGFERVRATSRSDLVAGALGLPLMVAIIGGEPRRFRPLVDLYRETGKRAGFSSDRLKVGVQSLGYVAAATQGARRAAGRQSRRRGGEDRPAQ